MRPLPVSTDPTRNLARGACVMLLLLTAAASVRAAEQPPTPRAERLAAEWEDVLLLDAFRHLRLSRSQLAGMLPLTRVPEEAMARFERENEQTIAAVERAAARHRKILLAGERPPAAEQQGAIGYERTLKQKRAAAEAEVARALAPRLAAILSRGQIAAALLLAKGEAPEGQAKSPALWDPPSGFVLADDPFVALRRSVIRRALSARYPAELLAARLQPPPIVYLSLGTLAVVEAGPPVRLETERVQPGREVSRFPQAQREALDRELKALQSQWKQPDRLLAGATEQEIAAALEPLTRRLFFSPRLRPVLNERLGIGPK